MAQFDPDSFTNIEFGIDSQKEMYTSETTAIDRGDAKMQREMGT
jgi:hypothetical protein